MGDNMRDELDVLVERVLRDCVSGETPPQRVWTNIRLGVQEQRGQASPRFRHVRSLWAEVISCGADFVVGARLILTPSAMGGENGWTERLVLAGHSSAPLHYSIHH